jgi:hypothetical protein
MANLGTNDAWRAGTVDSTSQYARMIPGISSIASHDPARRPQPAKRVVAINAGPEKPEPRKILKQLLLPSPIVDPFPLYRRVAADLMVLAGMCGLQAFIFPTWSLPRLDLPLFAVLVTLFEFSEGIYRPTADPLPEGVIPGLAKSVLFATALVCIAEFDEIRLQVLPVTFASCVAALVLYRQARRFIWAGSNHETEAHKVLIVGGGPVARAIARSLRQDSLHRTVVRGFVDDGSPSFRERSRPNCRLGLARPGRVCR